MRWFLPSRKFKEFMFQYNLFIKKQDEGTMSFLCHYQPDKILTVPKKNIGCYSVWSQSHLRKKDIEWMMFT